MSSSKSTIIDCPELRNKKVACLTLDVEQDYGDLLEEPCYEGLEYIPELVNFFKEKGIPLTCFVQGSLFETHSDKIRQLAELNVEFELHSYSHPKPGQIDPQVEIEKGKETYREFFGRDAIGYRSPLGVIGKQEYELLAANGFKFDSSVFPSLRPGTFNNLRKPTKPFRVNGPGIIEFPFTVFSDVFRIPIALSYIKLFGKPYLYVLKTFNLPSLIVFDFHLHDLFRLSSSKKIPLGKFSPFYRLIFRRIYQNSENGLATLNEFIILLQKKGYSFQKLIDVYEVVSK
ncbi:MAG: Peptidoglycan deacetylase [Syntrophomonadaceae bacterium]|nr:Peptidoglycan deacetylase [Bacillota bacterium]MBT9148052.1 Peptidoglycan deacetylase [Bacillota bacterium]